MTIFTVHHPAQNSAEIRATVERLTFVKEGFCWPALVFPLLWFLLNGLWLVVVLYVLIWVGLIAVIAAAGLSGFVAACVMLTVHAGSGLFANDLKRWTLRGRGHAEIAVVMAKGMGAAEQRYLEALAEDVGAPQTAGDSSPMSANVPGRTVLPPRREDAAGLFPAPGGAA